jgi:hypothetical protein
LSLLYFIVENLVLRARILYFFPAGLIPVITTVAASFSITSIDEPTALPGRRSLNEAPQKN